MTAATYINQLSPELCLLAGACLVWLMGVSKDGATRALMAPLSVVVVIAAMMFTWRFGAVGTDVQPAGILFTELSNYVRWITLSVGVLLLLANWHVPADGEQGEYFGMILCSLAGVMLTASANDLVVLFFALELVSVPTYVLVALSRTDQRSTEGALKYFFLGAFSAAITVYGFSFLYGVSGSTIMEVGPGKSLASYFAIHGASSNYALIGLVLAMSGLLFKVAAVPFHAYAPDVYEGAASPMTALLGFLPKLAGFVAIIKLLTTCAWQIPDELLWMLWIVAAATMTAGNVLALLQTNVKRMLAYSSIAHSGYMLMGILVGPTWGSGPMKDGVAAMLFYIVVYGVMNLGAFAVLSSLRVGDREVETLDDLAGLARRAPLAALALAVCVFSLMGFPPTAGFLGKVYLFSSAFSTGDQSLVVLAVIGVVNSAVAAAYYLRIVATCYMRDPSAEVQRCGGLPLRLTLGFCSLAMIALFIRPGDIVRQAQHATRYIVSTASTLASAATDARIP